MGNGDCPYLNCPNCNRSDCRLPFLKEHGAERDEFWRSLSDVLEAYPPGLGRKEPRVDKDEAYSKTPTPYAVNCPACGLVYLTKQEYNRQMSKPDSKWACPVCWLESTWDDDNYERYYGG